MNRMVELSVLLSIWYVFGALANVYCKQYLSYTKDVITLTLCQYLCGVAITAVCLLMFPPRNNSDHERKEMTRALKLILGMVCAFNAIGHLMTNASMNRAEVRFTHTVKGAEPLFSFFLTVLVLKQPVSRSMGLSLIPIIAGVVLATTSEFSYSHMAFLTAMASNLLFSSRNIFSKKLQSPWSKGGAGMDSYTLFLVLSLTGCAVLFPMWVVRHAYDTLLGHEHGAAAAGGAEDDGAGGAADAASFVIGSGAPRVEGGVGAAAAGPFPYGHVVVSLVSASLTHCTYNLVSFVILQKMRRPVTHAIANAMRRVFIVIVATLWFRNVVSPMNALGTVVAFAGVFWYSVASRSASASSASAFSKKADDPDDAIDNV